VADDVTGEDDDFLDHSEYLLARLARTPIVLKIWYYIILDIFHVADGWTWSWRCKL